MDIGEDPFPLRTISLGWAWPKQETKLSGALCIRALMQIKVYHRARREAIRKAAARPSRIYPWENASNFTSHGLLIQNCR